MKNRNIETLKEKLKEGTISYFSLSKEEIVGVTKALEEEIKKEQEEIENIKNKINIEKIKLQNSNV